MKPDEDQASGRVGTPLNGQRSFVHTPPSRDPQYRQQQAAADIIRAQLDSIYSGDATSPVTGQVTSSPTTTPSQSQPATAQPTVTPQAVAEQSSSKQPLADDRDIADVNPYERTHTPQTSIKPEQWKAYHSAWQDYYRRYYEGYYTKQIGAAKDARQPAQTSAPKTAFGSKVEQPDEPVRKTGPLTRNEAMQELRAKLLSQVEKSAKKARKSRHFVPVVAALGVVLIFGFLQYNQLLIANLKAYITPGSIDPQNIIVDPASTVSVGPDPRLIIPKINVDTPVLYDIPTDKASQDKAMENGVAQFGIPGANSKPGQIGNTVLSGHSSNDVFAAGDYKFIFMQLEKLEIGDTIYANYEGKRYTYIVTKKEEVLPSQVDRLIYDTNKPVMTLITCTPLGTALKRLLVTAEQVYPASGFTPAPTTTGSGSTQSTIPSQGQPTVIERLFGS